MRLAGEPDSPLDPVAHHPVLRAEALAHDRIDLALLCMSSPLGVEALPREEAQPLLDAWHEGVAGLDERFAAWGAIALDGAVPADVDAVLDAGAIGLSLPAGALADPGRLRRAGPLLEALERRDAPLLVHPGPGMEDRGAEPGGPAAWWPALAGYPAQLHAAWLAFAGWGRADHPRLRVVFAALAGGAPLWSHLVAHYPGARAYEDRLCFDGSTHRRTFGPGQAFGFGASDIHRVLHARDAPAVTLHAYSPPLWRMGAYQARSRARPRGERR